MIAIIIFSAIAIVVGLLIYTADTINRWQREEEEAQRRADDDGMAVRERRSFNTTQQDDQSDPAFVLPAMELPPLTEAEGREYEQQEMLDGQSREAEQRERSRGSRGTGFPYFND